jgi:tubulin--tyrosine ligase
LQERNEFLAEYKRREHEGLDNTWILKPSGGAHGDDIIVKRNGDDILNFIEAAGSTSWVVQKYLENPLLLPGGRKFDLRCMVLVDHNYSIYLYSEGILRTCSVAYSLTDLDNRFAHLANHCLQKDHPAYGSFANEPDNLMGYDAFASVLESMGATLADGCPVSLETHILPQIEKQVLYALLAAKEHMEVLHTSTYRCFNLLGFDFMLDDNFRVYLIEVNASPTTDPKLIPRLVEELVRVAIDPVFPSLSAATKISREDKDEFKLLWSPIR